MADPASQPFLDLIQRAYARDESLRAKYGTEHKFKFIHEHLKNCLAKLESDLETWQQQQIPLAEKALSENETIVYVYLFNAQGLSLSTWLPMLSAGVFYEYSVNRPIYTDEEHVKHFILSKKNPALYSYFSASIDKNAIQPKSDLLDATGHPLIKIKEGSLKRENLRRFFHAGAEYEIINNEFKKIT